MGVQPVLKDDGVTVIEQLISLLLGSVMIMALYSFFRTQLFQVVTQETKTATLEDVRGAFDIMIRDLKNAGAWVGGTPPAETGISDDPDSDADLICNPIYAASATKIYIQMDLNGNSNCSDSDPRENVRYELTGPTSTCGGKKIIRRNGDCLVANVSIPLAGKLFTYFDASGADLGPTPVLARIRRIRVTFAVRAKNPDARVNTDIFSELSTSVSLRN
jgi:type II secretory pathway component PulJ